MTKTEIISSSLFASLWASIIVSPLDVVLTRYQIIDST